MMAILREYETTSAAVIPHCRDWIDVAECLYGFDHLTAQRLAFFRWLHDTGRILDD